MPNNIIVLMGVSGSGKTTIGTELALRTSALFADADDFHPEANKKKMAAGFPLNDTDRQPWLEELNRILLRWHREGIAGILACSALKAKYRETLAIGLPQDALYFVLLEGSPQLIAARLATRKHEYMNPNLLQSQLKTLEPPPPGEAFCIVNDRPPAVIAAEILAHVAAPAPTSRASD